MASATPVADASAGSGTKVSPFFDPGPVTKTGSLAIVQLSRDNLLPIYLQPPTGGHDGYAEGHVVNTRYGSFPHSTMLGVPWGSQIRASMVDTGSRGKKRKRPTADEASKEPFDDKDSSAIEGAGADAKRAVAASSGFIHILPPTPENWTMSLPHRTQVVYTPDYSYILHRIRARPGSRLIEAGAGSGSFSHASARAVYNGYPTGDEKKGKVFSFEFHEQRYHKMREEISGHGLDTIVQLTHRDVYKDGFAVRGANIEADAVFLDLPAPWEALPHLSRSKPFVKGANGQTFGGEWVSVLNPKKSVHICTFSPCIEQVTKTVSAMRRLGWVDIEMVEIVHRKLHTVRERIGLFLQSERGLNNTAKDVEEALVRLSEIEDRAREHANPTNTAKELDADMDIDEDVERRENGTPAKRGRGDERAGFGGGADFLEGDVVIRGEPEIKTHTSYLVFAVLPREWSAEDEAAALAKWPIGNETKVIGNIDKATRKKEKRELLEQQTNKKRRKQQQAEETGDKTATTDNSQAEPNA